MKKTIIGMIMFVVILASFVGATVFEIENESEKLRVTMINQEPDPVAPGNTVDVRFRIENLRSEAAKNMEVKLVPKYPFSLYWQDEEIKEIGTVAPMQGGSNGVRVKYKLVVDKDAAEGDNEVEFLYRIDGGAWVNANDFTISVKTRDAVLAINEIETESDKIIPGTTTKVSFTLDNLADSVLKDIKLKLDVYSAVVTSTAVTYYELPFTPINSGNEKTLDKINPKKSAKMDFDLFTDADAESKVYKVPYVLTYSDEAGTNFTRSGIIGLMVDVNPDLSVNIDETEVYSAGGKGSVTIKFVNKGFSDIKFLDVVLKETAEFDLMSNPEVYIGNLDSDDYETAEYDIMLTEELKGNVELPLKIEYRDANGKLYSIEKEIILEIFEGKELSQRVGNGGNPMTGVIIVLVIIVVGIFFWRRMKKKKK